MFSRFYSPKQWLAAQLSQAVAEFFDVDPQRVETNLLQDAKVVLYDLELKPQPYEKSLTISGRIEKVEFSWAWEVSAALITDVTFTMEGVHVYVKRQKMPGGTIRHHSTIVSDGDEENSNNADSSSEWKANYLQQILDHLKLMVTDFTIHIQLDSSKDAHSEEEHSELLVQAKDIHVEQVSPSQLDAFLCQRLVVGSLEAWIEKKSCDGATIHPVLEPFGYEASVQRISGRRFVDGVTKGLMVQGKIDEGASAIRFHAGVVQIQAFSQLQHILLKAPDNEDSNRSTLTESEAKGSSKTAQEIPIIASNPSESSSTGTDFSVFSLPLRSMAVVLEGGAEFRLQDLMIQYCADGSELAATCRQGLWNDATQFATGTYTLDFIRNEFRVGATDDDGEEVFHDTRSEAETRDIEDENNIQMPNRPTVRLDLTVGMLAAVYQGMLAIFPYVPEGLAIQGEGQMAKVDGEVPWTVQVEGNLRIRVNDIERGKWVECNLDHPKMIICESIEHSSFEWRTLQIGPSSFGSFHVSVPSLVATPENNRHSVQCPILANGSMDDVTHLNLFFTEMKSSIGYSSEDITEISMPFLVNQMEITVDESHSSPSGKINISRIHAHGFDWDIGSIHVFGFGGVSMEASTVKGVLGKDKIDLKVACISKAVYEGVGQLTQALQNMEIIYQDESLSVNCPELHYQYFDSDSANLKSSKISHPPQGKVSYEVQLTPVSFSTEHLVVSSLHQEGILECVNLSVDLKSSTSTSTSTVLEIRSASLQAKMDGMGFMSTSNITASGNFSASINGRKNDIYIRSLGYLCSCSCKTQEIQKLSISSVGHLTCPCKNTTIIYCQSSDNISIDVDTIHFEGPSLGVNGSQFGDPAFVESEPLFTIPIQLNAKRIMIMPELGPRKPSICFDGVWLELTASSDSSGLDTVVAKCSYLQARGPLDSELVMKGTSLKAAKGYGRDSFGLQSAELTVQEIPKIEASRFGRLSKPINAFNISMRDQAIFVNIGEINFAASSTLFEKASDLDSQDTSNAYSFLPPLPIHLFADRIRVIQDSTNAAVSLKALTMDYAIAPGGVSNQLHIDCKQMEAEALDCKIKLEGIDLKISTEKNNESKLVFPGIGGVSVLSVGIEEILELRVSGAGQIVKPIHGFLVGFKQNAMEIIFGTIHFQEGPISIPRTNGDKDVPKFKSVSSKFPILFPVTLKLDNGIFMPTLENRDRPGAMFQSVQLKVFPSELQDSADIYVTCSLLDTIGDQSFSMTARKIYVQGHFECFRDDKTDTHSHQFAVQGYGLFSRGSVEIESVSKLNIPGSGRLYEELKSTEIFLASSGINANTGILKWDIESTTGKQSTTDTQIGREDATLWSVEVPVQINLGGVCLKYSDKWAHISAVDIMLQQDKFVPLWYECSASCGTFCGGSTSEDSRIKLSSLSSKARIRFDLKEGSDSELFCGIGFLSSARINIVDVTSFKIARSGLLTAPVKHISAELKSKTLHVECDSLSMATAPPMLRAEPPMPVQFTAQDSSCWQLPFRVQLLINSIDVQGSQFGGKMINLMRCNQAFLLVDPGTPLGTSDVGLSASCVDLQYSTSTKVPKLAATALLNLNRLDTISHLVVELNQAELKADLTSTGWAGPAEPHHVTPQSHPLRFPFARVSRFDLTLQINGAVISLSDSKLHCEKFEGEEKTDSEDISRHYVGIVKQRIPFLISKTKIMGANIGDSVGMMAGTVAMKSSIIGSVVGIGGRDAIGGALSMGKISRGVSETEKYKFGDFSRGIVASTKAAANSGTNMRGDSKYVFGDFSAGTSKSAGKYASENRERLGGVGGASIGMIAGAALLGPVGLIAGSLLGSSAGQASMKIGKKGQNMSDNAGTEQIRSPSKTRSTPSSQEQPYGRYVSPPQQAFQHANPMMMDSDPSQNTQNTTAAIVQSSHPLTPILESVHLTNPYSAPSYPIAAVETFSASPNPVSQVPLYTNSQANQYAMQQPTMYQQGTTSQSTTRACAPTMHSQQPYYQNQSPQTGYAQAGVARAPVGNPPTPHQMRQNPRPQNQQEEYNFGDVTRGIVDRGKRNDGRNEKSGYKFGDFTRGLFR